MKFLKELPLNVKVSLIFLGIVYVLLAIVATPFIIGITIILGLIYSAGTVVNYFIK